MSTITRRQAIAALLSAPVLVPQTTESAVARTDAMLARIERLNPLLNAFVTVTAERARADARAADAARARGTTRSQIDGLIVGHKDLFETAGIRTTAGSRLFDQYLPARDATVVARLAAAGTIFAGKTNTHELGGGVTTINPFYGTTRNPWDTTRIAGGSSGGSAAAVAAGLVAAATGSDTGGSVRIPAAFCGCVGLKPTFGRVSTAGLLGASPTFDHSGIITRTVTDAWLVYREIAGYDPADPSTVQTAAEDPALVRGATVTGLRIGVARNFFFDGLDTAVAEAMDNAIRAFRGGGAEIRDTTFPIDSGTMARVFDPIVVAEIHERFVRDWKERPQDFSPGFAGFFNAAVPSGLELAAAHRALRAYQQAARQLFDSVDVILTPTVPSTAPRIDGPINGGLILRNTWPFNAARTPAISVPCGFDPAGLPIGLQLTAAPFAEATLFRVARFYESATGWHRLTPQL